MAEPIPDKGRVLTAMIGVLVRAARRRAPAATCVSTDARRPARRALRRPGAGRADDAVPQGRDAADRVHRAGLPAGSAWKEYRDQRARCTAPRCRPACRSRPAARAGVHAVDQGRGGHHDENISFDARRRPGRRASWPTQARDISPRALPRGAERARRARDHHRRHQVRARAGRRRAGRCATRCSRRTRPASGRPTSGSPAPPRRASTSSRCATTSTASTGTRPRRPRRCPPRSSRPPAAATSRPTSASPAVASPTGPGVALTRTAQP